MKYLYFLVCTAITGLFSFHPVATVFEILAVKILFFQLWLKVLQRISNIVQGYKKPFPPDYISVNNLFSSSSLLESDTAHFALHCSWLSSVLCKTFSQTNLHQHMCN